MRGRGSRISRFFDDNLVLGLLIIGAALVVLYISYTAQQGLPWKASYSIDVKVKDAGKLPKGADVRVGGARVGQVLKIEPAPREGKEPAHAVLKVKLEKEGTPLPVDTTAEVRLASVLGSKYLALDPGDSKKTIPEGGSLSLANSSVTVDVDEAFQVFGPEGRKSVQTAVSELGEAFAGRGEALNETIGSLAAILPGFQRVLTVVVDPSTDLAGFVRGAAAATAAVSAVAPELEPFVGNSNATLAALDAAGDALSESIRQFPGTATATTDALRTVQPVLDDAAAITADLEPAAGLLPATTRRLDVTLRTAIRVDPRTGTLAAPLDRALKSVGTFAKNPNSRNALELLGGDDLATFGTSAFVGLGAILKTVYAAERACGVTSNWTAGLAGISGDGDAGGNWLRMIPLFELAETLPATSPAPELHANPYPNENANECEAGNEGYPHGQAIGNPAGLQGKPKAAP